MILKFLTPEVTQEVLQRVGAEDGDIVFFGADQASVVNDAIGILLYESIQNSYKVEKI